MSTDTECIIFMATNMVLCHSMVIKTGCSASLVAVHEACRALQAGDIESAVVGGTSILLSPYNYSVMGSEGVLSPKGSCKPFDASADGFARAEAINAVFLKRFDDAIRDGNPIRAVIRNSGTNANGCGGGLIAPDSKAQAALIRDVYEAAGLDPSDTPCSEVGKSCPALLLMEHCPAYQ